MQRIILEKKDAGISTYETNLCDFTILRIMWMDQIFTEFNIQCMRRLDINLHIWDKARIRGITIPFLKAKQRFLCYNLLCLIIAES